IHQCRFDQSQKWEAAFSQLDKYEMADTEAEQTSHPCRRLHPLDDPQQPVALCLNMAFPITLPSFASSSSRLWVQGPLLEFSSTHLWKRKMHTLWLPA